MLKIFFLLIKLVLFLALFNVPLIAYSIFNYLPRAVFNIDYFVLLLISCFWYRRWYFIFILLLLWFLDFGSGSAAVYHFNAPIDFFKSVEFLGNLRIFDSLLMVMLGVVGLLLLSGVFIMLYEACGLKGVRSGNKIVLLFVPLIFILADILNGSLSALSSGVGKTSFNLSGSAGRLVAISLFEMKKKRVLTWRSERSATSILTLDNGIFDDGRSVVFVLMESFGLPVNDELPKAWMRYISSLELDRDYIVEFDKVTFKGATTDGELRELCLLQGSYYLIDESVASKCVPNLFKKHGYRTHAFHGFSPAMFSRDRWWGLVGLDDRHFGDEIVSRTGRACGGVFRGACDSDLLNIAFSDLKEMHDFTYVLTLNGHLPLVDVKLSDRHQNFCTSHNLPASVCMLNATYLKIFDQLAYDLKSRKGKKPFIVLVGDHAPPFSNKDDRSFFAEGLVPVFYLIPHD